MFGFLKLEPKSSKIYIYIISAGRSELFILYINGLKIETALFNSRSAFLAPRTKTLIPLRFAGHLQGLC